MSSADKFTIHDKPLDCSHCGHDRFRHRRGQVNTAAMTFLKLDWLDSSADIYICERCGHLHWFLGDSLLRSTHETEDRVAEPDAPEEDDTSLPSECLACGETIAAGRNRCPKCGWSYQGS